MNVLFLDQYSALGGAQQCLLDLLPAISERGWNARVAVPPGGPLIDRIRALGLPVNEIKAGPYQSGTKSAGDLFRFATDVPRQTAAISALLDDSPIDLVYVNGPRVLIAAALAARKRAPVLFHAHHSIGQRGALYLAGLALRQSGAMVAACCEAVAQPLRKWVPQSLIQTVPNGTADFGFRQRTFERGREVRIGIVGRIAPEKGQAEFLRAAALLVRHAPHARFVICGGPLFGDRGYYGEVLRLAADLPVEFLDWQQDMPVVMGSLDILVIASTEEGMPRVLLEAFSAGVAVVARAVGGIPEVIEDRVTGFLADDLAAGLIAVLDSDPWKVREVTRHARLEWELRYTLLRYRENIMQLMEKCAAREIVGPLTHKSAMRQAAPGDSRNA